MFDPVDITDPTPSCHTQEVLEPSVYKPSNERGLGGSSGHRQREAIWGIVTVSATVQSNFKAGE